jgi:hypothetical protein
MAEPTSVQISGCPTRQVVGRDGCIRDPRRRGPPPGTRAPQVAGTRSTTAGKRPLSRRCATAATLASGARQQARQTRLQRSTGVQPRCCQGNWAAHVDHASVQACEVVLEIDGAAAGRAVSEDSAAQLGELVAGHAGRAGGARCGAWEIIGAAGHAPSGSCWALSVAGSNGAIAHSHNAAFSSSSSG